MGISFPFLFLALTSISIHQAQSSGFTTEYIGCFKDKNIVSRSSGYRAMTFVEDMGNDATIERCTSICYNAGKSYAGLQYSDLCFCSNGGYDRYGEDPDGCKDACTGDNTQICGDSRRNSVYQITPTTNMFTISTSSANTTTTTTDTTTTTTTTSTNKNPVTGTTQSNSQTNSSEENQTDSSVLNNLKQTTEPNSATKNLGTYIGAGVGAVAGGAALIIVILVMVKRRGYLKKKGESNGAPGGEERFSMIPGDSDSADVERQAALQAVTERDEYENLGSGNTALDSNDMYEHLENGDSAVYCNARPYLDNQTYEILQHGQAKG